MRKIKNAYKVFTCLILGFFCCQDISGQNYEKLFLKPFLLDNIYGGKEYNYECYGECLSNDTVVENQIIINCVQNESISIYTSSFPIHPKGSIIKYEEHLTYDSQKRIKEYSFNSTLGSIKRYSYKYLDQHTLEIEYTSNTPDFYGSIRSISTLKYDRHDHLIEFHRMFFFENDSVSSVTYEVKSNKNETTIQYSNHKETYFFNDKNQCTGSYYNGSRHLEIDYNKNGRIKKILTYTVSIDSLLGKSEKYSYGIHGILAVEEYSYYRGGEFWFKHNCLFCEGSVPK